MSEKSSMEKYTHQGPPLSVRASLKKHLPSVSAVRLLAAVSEREVKINGRRIRQGETVQPGDRVEVFLPPQCTSAPLPEIVFEDQRLMVVKKPAGLPTVGQNSLETRVKLACGERTAAVHRLDTNTSGLVLFAKDPQSEQALLSAIREGRIRKFYSAVLCRPFGRQEGVWSDYLFKDAKAGKVTLSDRPKKGYLPASTAWRILACREDLCLSELELFTGRTHQIRAQSAFHNHPVLGDGKYGDPDFNRRYHRNRQCLCAKKLILQFRKDSPLSDLSGLTVEIEDPFSPFFHQENDFDQ